MDEYGFRKPVEYEFPECSQPNLSALFKTTPGKTDLATYFTVTSGPPAKVPPRRIPAHFREGIDLQIQEMLAQNVIEESSSPWMAPAVFTRKKSGGVCICVDYRELNNTQRRVPIHFHCQMRYRTD